MAEQSGLSHVGRLPYCLKVLLENQLRHEDGDTVTAGGMKVFQNWVGNPAAGDEIAFHPARVVMQDTTGVPLLVDLADLREAARERGIPESKVNPVRHIDLILDHSVYVDVAGSPDAMRRNVEIEFSRNRERFEFVRWVERGSHRRTRRCQTVRE